MNAETSTAWYADGLRFTCTQCGNCCTGAPGYVFVTREEIARIAAFLGGDCSTTRQSNTWLGKEHLRRVGLRYSLTEDKRNGDCCFLKTDGGKRICSIYPVRPLQCRTWPFWNGNLASRKEWDDASKGCPGMNHGRQYDLVQIEVRRRARVVEDLPK